MGTEGRAEPGREIPPDNEIYEYIMFRASDVKDGVLEQVPPPMAPSYNYPYGGYPGTMPSNAYPGMLPYGYPPYGMYPGMPEDPAMLAGAMHAGIMQPQPWQLMQPSPMSHPAQSAQPVPVVSQATTLPPTRVLEATVQTIQPVQPSVPVVHQPVRATKEEITVTGVPLNKVTESPLEKVHTIASRPAVTQAAASAERSILRSETKRSESASFAKPQERAPRANNYNERYDAGQKASNEHAGLATPSTAQHGHRGQQGHYAQHGHPVQQTTRARGQGNFQGHRGRSQGNFPRTNRGGYSQPQWSQPQQEVSGEYDFEGANKKLEEQMRDMKEEIKSDSTERRGFFDDFGTGEEAGNVRRDAFNRETFGQARAFNSGFQRGNHRGQGPSRGYQHQGQSLGGRGQPQRRGSQWGPGADETATG
jgi:protein LSM14